MRVVASRDAIVTHLDALLRSQEFNDYGPNGLQVPGRSEVSTIVSGVSANRALIEAAAAMNADLLLVHHGLFWGQTGPIDAVLAGRLRPLFAGDISLVAYHLPLDAHPVVGNNALLADVLGLSDRRGFAEHRGQRIGVAGHLPGAGLSAAQLVDAVGAVTQPPIAFLHGPDVIRTVGIVSGGASDDIAAAAALGLDAFITGEPNERAQGLAEELGIHFLAAGHHCTERFGIRTLGELIAAEFQVTHTFIDVENPV
jgi:dinuclear metal center YbgI/SA1388 family protein